MRRLLALAAMLLASAADAHIVAAGQGAVRIQVDSTYVLASVPTSVLSGYDDNGDSLIDRAELNAHREQIEQQASALLSFRSDGKEGRLVFGDLLLSHPDTKGDAELVVMRRYQWTEPVKSLRVELAAPLAAKGLAMRVIEGERSEAVLLTAQRAAHTFLADGASTFKTFAASGIEHILLGPDHLLFLLTVLVAGAGWRYWLAVVTSFTVAHSITLACTALGLVDPPSRIVEPLIAASIVLLALDNLLRGQRAATHRAALVFACGLLHGMGIASALTELGLAGPHTIAGLAGFNIGVEIGQLAFVLAALLVIAAMRRVAAPHWHAPALRVSSIAAAAIGSWWMVERLF